MDKTEEIIKKRIKNDDERLENAYAALNDLADNKHDRTYLKSNDESLDKPVALKCICDWLEIEAPDFDMYSPGSEGYITDILRKNGVMSRPCKLSEDWYKYAVGAYLCEFDNGRIAAILPDQTGTYYYNDLETGRKVKVNRSNAGRISKDAFIYYRPLPQRSLSGMDLFGFMMKTVRMGDIRRAVIAAFVIAVIGMILPMSNSLMLRYIIPSRNSKMIMSLAVFLISAVFARYLVSILQSLTLSRITQRMTVMLQSSLFARVLDLPTSFFRKYNTGDIYGSLTFVESLCTVWSNIWFSSGVTVIFSLIYLIQIRSFLPQMLLPAAGVLAVELVIQILGILGLRRNVSDRINSQVVANSRALDTLAGIEQVKVFGAQKRALSRYAEIYKQQSDAEYKPPFFVKLQNALLPAVNIFGIGVLFLFADQARLSNDEFIFFYSAFGLANSAVAGLTGLGSQIASITPIVKLLKPIIETEPEITAGGRNPGRLSGRISLEHVEFRYSNDTPPILNDLNLHIREGEYIAIVGESGSGKTTITRLLLGFEKPQHGAVYYDGENLNNLDLAFVRQQIGVVLQSGKLFTGNIYTNIAISCPGLSEEDAWKAAAMAGIADDIKAMPLGMYTVISEGTGTISGGQKQRLLIARVIAQNPSVLILDEATSSLDNITQKKVTDALATMNCTRIVIAHRLSTIKGCDRIVVLDQGKISEEGSYEELIKKNGRFAELVRFQLMETEQGSISAGGCNE
jgi:NHLM bacteriocin system ABC transporter ATP-binding protein